MKLSFRAISSGSATILLLFAVITHSASTFGQDRRAEVQADTLFCGPSSVVRVLEFYGQTIDLSGIVIETQWPDYAKGASLDALSEALRKRGIHTQAVKVDPRMTIEWKYPVIVHLQKGDAAHYVVWLPPDGTSNKPAIWDNSFRAPLGAAAYARARTGYMLLTSSSAISEHDRIGQMKVAAKRQISWLLAINSLVLGGAAAAAILPAISRLHFRKGL